MRKWVQWITALVTNAYVPGFLEGKIYNGSLKQICVPGLNCYSCPGALGSCPLGALQSVLSSVKYKFSFYVVGFLMAFGALFGRFICGFLCPFGLIQELFYKIPFFKVKRPWKWPRYLKYGILIVFVIWLPLFAVNQFGIGSPAFCQYICPAGTLTAGFPLLALNPALRSAVGWLFSWKVFVLFIIVIGCLLIYRFFCRYLCPLGAIYALFNKISIYQLRLEREKCTDCGACAKACMMGVDPSRKPEHTECIRCGECVKACRFGALQAGFRKKPVEVCRGCKAQDHSVRDN